MPATPEAIRKIMTSPDWTPAEKWVVKWQVRYLGDFEESLASAISLADGSNLDLLARVFPVQVSGFRQWTQGNLAERLRAAGLAI